VKLKLRTFVVLNTTDWVGVSEQILNGTSAQIRLYSAIHVGIYASINA